MADCGLPGCVMRSGRHFVNWSKDVNEQARTCVRLLSLQACHCSRRWLHWHWWCASMHFKYSAQPRYHALLKTWSHVYAALFLCLHSISMNVESLIFGKGPKRRNWPNRIWVLSVWISKPKNAFWFFSDFAKHSLGLRERILVTAVYKANMNLPMHFPFYANSILLFCCKEKNFSSEAVQTSNYAATACPLCWVRPRWECVTTNALLKRSASLSMFHAHQSVTGSY